MFKKTVKKSNLKENIPDSPNEVDRIEEQVDEVEPKIKKKLKTPNSQFTTASVSQDYKTAVQELTEDLKYKAKPELIGKTDEAAFNYNEIDTDYTQDSKAIALKNIKISQDIKAGKLDKKFYKGINGYAEYNEKSDNSIRSSKFTGSLGPIRAPKHIRVTCRFDYNPSLCKDWHDTGSCVFGDSCIYIHDRGDYKSGWELEKEWEEEQKKKAKNNGHLSSDDSEPEEALIKVPEICPICEKKLSNAIRTLCGHFFCEKCALSHHSKSQNCFACQKPTNGTFNDGVLAIKKLQEALQNQLDSKKKSSKNVQEINKKLDNLDLPEDLSEGEKRKLMEGIEFGNKEERANQGEDLNGLANEFIKKRAKQKGKIKYESDWLL